MDETLYQALAGFAAAHRWTLSKAAESLIEALLMGAPLPAGVDPEIKLRALKQYVAQVEAERDLYRQQLGMDEVREAEWLNEAKPRPKEAER
jgi:hypothetical protein